MFFQISHIAKLKTTTSSKKIVYNSLLNTGTTLLASAVSFMMIPFFISVLGTASFGIWILIGSIFQYRNILSLGISSAVNRYVPLYLVKNDYESINKVISTTFIHLSMLALFLILITIVLYFNITDFFNIPNDLTDISRILVLIVGISFAISLPLDFSAAVLSGYQRYDIINYISLSVIIFRTVLLILLLLGGAGLFVMGFVYGLSEILLRVMQFIYLKRNIVQFKLAIKLYDLKLLKNMLYYGTNTLLYVLSTLLIFKSSDIIIAIYLSPSQITGYYSIISIVLALGGLLQTALSVIKPAITDLDARQDVMRLKELALLSHKYSLLFLIPTTFFFLVFGKEFLNIWLGENFLHLEPILSLLIISNFFYASQYSSFLVLVGKGEHKAFGLIAIGMAVISVILSIVAVASLKLGLTGIAYANLISVIVGSGILLPIYFYKKMKIKSSELFKEVWIPSIRGTIPCLITTIILKYYLPPQNWYELLFVISIIAFITFTGIWLLTLNVTEKNRVINILKLQALTPKLKTK